MKRSQPRCPAEHALAVIGGPWKILILYHLRAGPCRFSALRRELASATPKMLTKQLREMESDQILRRRVYPQIPPRVEYSLTPRGRSLLPVVDAMCRWGSGRSCGRK